MTTEVTRQNNRGHRQASASLAVCLIVGSLMMPAFAQSVPSDADFVAKAAVGDIFEIESGKLAEIKTSPNASRLAEPLASDHTAMLADLRALVQGGKVKADIPAALDAANQGKFDKLKSLKGGAFDKGYFDMQVDVQREYVALFESYARDGGNSELKGFAAKYLPRLQKHLKNVTDTRTVIMDE